jgi:hypothetical protein
MRLSIEGVHVVEHRIEAFEGSQVTLLSVTNASLVGDPATKGSTRSLILQPGSSPYEIVYAVRQTSSRSERCPLWLPTIPTDGRSRGVALHVQLPDATLPGRSMPLLHWTGTSGTTTLAHVPAFVRVPYVREGESPAWDVAAIIDSIALFIILVSTALWWWQRKRTTWA